MYLRRHKYCQNIKKVPHKYACDTFRGVYCSRIPPPWGGERFQRMQWLGKKNQRKGSGEKGKRVKVRKYGKGNQVKWRKGKKNMKNERNSRENGRKSSMWSLNLRKSGEENQTRNARGGGKESKALELYTPLDTFKYT